MKRLLGLLPLSLALPVVLSACGGGDDSSSWLSVNSRVGSKFRTCGVLSAGQYGPSSEAAFPVEGPSEADYCEVDCIVAADCSELTDAVCSEEFSEGLTACLDACSELEPEFTCGDGERIPAGWECDAEPDCEDGSDEVGCPAPFICGDQEIPQGYVCDGFDDCEAGEDEVGCAEPALFQCADGSEVPLVYECDGDPDCEDGSDEEGCATLTCPE